MRTLVKDIRRLTRELKDIIKDNDSNISKFHWYCFIYRGTDIKTGKEETASVYAGYTKKDKITKTMIEDNKKHANVETGSVLIAISYLGEMTKEEFEG